MSYVDWDLGMGKKMLNMSEKRQNNIQNAKYQVDILDGWWQEDSFLNMTEEVRIHQFKFHIRATGTGWIGYKTPEYGRKNVKKTIQIQIPHFRHMYWTN